MNPMVDMAFLLVTFFMLTTTFKMPQVLSVNTPASFADTRLPETDVIILSVSPEGRIFLDMDGKFTRQKLLARMGERYNIAFTDAERNAFGLLGGFGMPVEGLSSFLNLPPEQRKAVVQPGIPADSAQNQLRDWLIQARLLNPAYRVAIRADRDLPYAEVDQLLQTLLDQNITRFNLITDPKVEKTTEP
jgi:biopolymer transport protein ExbD